jgi:spore coat protein U-like protein
MELRSAKSPTPGTNVGARSLATHMGTPRWSCIAAVFPDNQLMVVGGYNDSVELATVEY